MTVTIEHFLVFSLPAVCMTTKYDLCKVLPNNKIIKNKYFNDADDVRI